MRQRINTLFARLHPYLTIDFARGVGSVALGLAAVARPDLVLTLLSYIVALYFIADGIIDLWVKRQFTMYREVVWLAVLDVVMGVLILGNIEIHRVSLTPYIFALLFVVRGLVHGSNDLYNGQQYPLGQPVRRSMGNEGAIKIVGALTFFILAPIGIALLVTFLGLYLIFDGIAYIAGAIARSPTGRDVVVYATHPDQLAPEGDMRALIFLRRSGAMGLGHVGWAFEWPKGWFNAGSVENPTSKPFARPDETGFWNAHTLLPIATAVSQYRPYDEFKVFRVANSDPHGAWNIVEWVAHQPYFIVRGNCVDRVYDVLRTFGVAELIDPARLNAPNVWFDALPGPSYRIADFSAIPVRPATEERAARLPQATIMVTIPEDRQGTIPPWRLNPARAWYEGDQLADKIADNVRRFSRLARARWRQRQIPRQDATIPSLTTATAEADSGSGAATPAQDASE